jgi:hypothetical protein
MLPAVKRLLALDPPRGTVALTKDQDWLVIMRATDLLEKLAHEHPEWVEPYKEVFLSLANSDKWEIRLQVVRALPLFNWRHRERRRVVEILLRDVDHPQTFVKPWALDGLATLAAKDKALMPVVRRSLAQFQRSGSKALATRAEHIKRRLGEAGQGRTSNVLRRPSRKTRT